jgi:dihydroorotate dehydrogenase electron transfer subunit
LLPVLAELPESWLPGDELSIRGPLGRGFQLPPRARRVALATLAGNPGRLLPLAAAALAQGCEVALCCDASAADLPAAVEVCGLADLPSTIAWADYLAVDIKIEELEGLEEKLKVRDLPRALDAQALVASPMPCGGMAKCGVCAVPVRKGERMLCEDGPVLDLRELLAS